MPSRNAARRTFQPVRRDSRTLGTIEAHLWRPTNAREKGEAIKAAERFDVLHKAKGARNGPLGHVALEVYRALWRVVRFSDGCLCPSLAWIGRATGRSKGAIVAALKRLKAAGFLTWIRRLEAVDGPPGVRGPQVRQVTNAYALGVPAAGLKLLASHIPIPPDELDRRLERDRFIAECERQAADFSPVGEALRRLGSAVMSASLPGGVNPPLGSISLERGAPAAR